MCDFFFFWSISGPNEKNAVKKQTNKQNQQQQLKDGKVSSKGTSGELLSKAAKNS